MTLKRFLADGEDTWAELEQLVSQARNRPGGLGSVRLLRLGELYRATTADLSAARARFPGDPVVARLEALVVRARSVVYAKQGRRLGIVEFYKNRYWELIAERPRVLLAAFATLMVPAIIGYLYALASPEAAAAVVPVDFLWVTEEQPFGTDLGLNASQLAEFSFFVLVNNIRVTLTAFAVGIGFGIGTFLLIAFNGLLFGVLTALAIGAGNSALFVEAVAAHGVIEFSCIVLGGVAGYRIGVAAINPGLQPRRVALVDAARSAGQLVLGTAPFLIMAGFVEGFVSRTGTSAVPSAIIGILIGVAFWGMVFTRGRAQTRTRALASR